MEWVAVTNVFKLNKVLIWWTLLKTMSFKSLCPDCSKKLISILSMLPNCHFFSSKAKFDLFQASLLLLSLTSLSNTGLEFKDIYFLKKTIMDCLLQSHHWYIIQILGEEKSQWVKRIKVLHFKPTRYESVKIRLIQ